MSRRLPNYLRTYRKRMGLTQFEVSFLMGRKGGSKLCRYENRRCVPNAYSLFALEVILGTPVEELFAGAYETVEGEIVERIRHLIRVLEEKPSCSPVTAYKLKTLRAAEARISHRLQSNRLRQTSLPCSN